MKTEPIIKIRTRIFSSLKKNFLYYFITCAAALVLNFLYRSGDCSLLTWILAPTARWAQILGGLPFEHLPGMGYVNKTYQFLIAPPCCGIRFLQIMLFMLVFSYTHDIPDGTRKLLWFPFCLIFSYFATILVNGIRIVLSIYVPLWMKKFYLLPATLSAKRLHTLIGTAIYFSDLLLLQPILSALVSRLFLENCTEKDRDPNPVLWYFLAVLALPFAKRLVTGTVEGFGGYALPIVLTCSCILFIRRGLKR